MASVSVTVKFGKGSNVLFDFEDGDISDWKGTDEIFDWIDAENAKNPDAKFPIYKPDNYSNPINSKDTTTFLATKENGNPVKSGNNALALTLQRTYDKDMGGWSYNYAYYTGDPITLRDVANGKNATKIGMWVHFPKEAAGIYVRFPHTFTKDATGKLYTNYDYFSCAAGTVSEFKAIPESGWVYIYYDLTAYNFQSTALYNPNESYANNNGKGANGDYYPAFLQFFTNTYLDHADDLTLYIDDITLDYSDVTDDRDAPAITNPTVSIGADNTAALNDQTITANTVSFAANIAENTAKSNATGLDYTTAKVYIDGKAMSGIKASGNLLALSEIKLANGLHEVVFEIADKQGNYTKLAKTLTINSAENNNSVVSISGRNDSNATPQAGSVYYIDVKATDASSVAEIKTALKLNNANDFVTEWITAAKGVEFTYELNEIDNVLTLSITSDGSVSAGDALVSIPTRVWAWDEAVAGVAADTVKNSPDVDIVCTSLLGDVAYIGGSTATFYSAINAETVLVGGTGVGGTTWHKHTAADVADLDPTCTEVGYTGRTYCEACASIVNFGEKEAAKGHNFAITEGVLKCECGEHFTGVWEDGKAYVDGVVVADGWVDDSYFVGGKMLTGICQVEGFYYDFGDNGVCAGKAKYTGLIYDEANGIYRYSKVGVIANGWNLIDDSWYYFDINTNAAVSGAVKLGPVTFEFEENGKLVSGVWAKTLYGTRYYYGPTYYFTGWQTIDGKDYYFEQGNRLEGGFEQIRNMSAEVRWFHFDENGVCDKSIIAPDGFRTDRNGLGYSKNGNGLVSLQYINDAYYYFDSYGYAKKGNYMSRLFGDDYKAITGLVTNNSGTLCYYKEGRPYIAGLVEVDGDYYFAYGKNGEVAVNTSYYAWMTSCDLPKGSNYEFGADGKMLNGIVNKNGKLYYYNTGKPMAAGLVEVDGDYYFAGGKDGEITVNASVYTWANTTNLPKGTYEFGADGKILNGIVDKDGTLCYYVMGRPKMAGLVEVDGDYYFAYGKNGEVATGKAYVWESNGIALENPNCEFGADGKMLNGIVDKDGTLCYYVMGRPKMAGLIKVDDDYYFAYGKNGEVATGKAYVWESNGIALENPNCEFGADGKMLNGIVDKDGTLCYYVMGRPKMAGLVEVDGDYYFAYGKNGEVVTNSKYYAWKTSCDFPAGVNYEFSADGKMLDGIVNKNGKLYYYETGKPVMAGLVEVDGVYYFANGKNGEVATGKTYVWETNGIMPEDNYEFGADGKMLNGFVTKADGLYYYDNGKYGKLGLNCIDGDYYFVDYGGKLITGTSYYVWETNDLSINFTYTFDAYGRIIL